jgi:arginine/lysine/ornithine decarboxylase
MAIIISIVGFFLFTAVFVVASMQLGYNRLHKIEMQKIKKEAEASEEWGNTSDEIAEFLKRLQQSQREKNLNYKVPFSLDSLIGDDNEDAAVLFEFNRLLAKNATAYVKFLEVKKSNNKLIHEYEMSVLLNKLQYAKDDEALSQRILKLLFSQ